MTDWDGEGYEQISDLQRHLAQRTLSALEFRGDERLLDVGCGDGFITRSIAARLSRGLVVGVDASPRMIRAALAKPDPPGAQIRFEVCDSVEMPFIDEFDVVVSFNVLHWIVDQHAALEAIATATKPGGRVIVQMVCAGPRPSLEKLAMAVCSRPRWHDFFADFAPPYIHVEPSEYAGIAASAGLLVATQTVQDIEWDFGSREAFARWCTVGFADWIARLVPDAVSEWVDDVVTDYQQLVGGPGLFRFMQLRAEMTPAAR